MSAERGAFFIVLLCATLCVVPVGALDHAAGIELGFLSVPLLTEDPYSFAASAGLWYEWNELWGRPWVLGAWVAAAGFRPMDDNFGTSVMYYGGLEFGYAFPLFRANSVRLNLRPITRLGWYYRSVEVLDEAEWGSRPFLSAGCILTLISGPLDLGITALVSVPMDNSPVVLFGFLQRLGLCF